MSLKTISWFVFVLLVAVVQSGCPPPENIVPCTCSTYHEYFALYCNNVSSEYDLELAVQGSQGYGLFLFLVRTSTLRYLPSVAFKGTKFVVVSIQKSSLAAISETEFAFEGLEKSLVSVLLHECTFTNNWDWGQLGKMKKLRTIRLTESDLLSITDNLKQVSHLSVETLDFSFNKISWLADDVFAGFTKLEILRLKTNLITELKRSMFPNPALILSTLELRNNQIQSLPEDIFINMPSLTSLNLSENMLTTLDENTFQPVWNQLHSAYFRDLPLMCDCRLAWITREKSPKYVYSTCRYPERLKNRDMTSLNVRDLWC